jgi:hypothetical protein
MPLWGWKMGNAEAQTFHHSTGAGEPNAKLEILDAFDITLPSNDKNNFFGSCVPMTERSEV